MTGQVISDALFLSTVEALQALYRGFPWESQIWAGEGHRRSPYRALVLFGLSSRTRDGLLAQMCRRFFQEFPMLEDFLAARPGRWETVRAIVRTGQLPFVQSSVEVLERGGGMVPQTREGLKQIKGVGDKVAECVVAYGWGRDGVPVDAHVCRVLGRLSSLPLNPSQDRASLFRQRVKEIYQSHRHWMAQRGVALVDLHEMFRLHGQLVCARVPQCSRCPLHTCPSRKAPYGDGTGPVAGPTLWQEWRELLLDPVRPENRV